MFINYNPTTGISFNTYRHAGAYAGDLADVLEAIQKEGAAVCCDYDGAKDALCDGVYLAQVGAGQEEVEELHNAIADFERQRFNGFAGEWGEAEFGGKRYALTSQASLTNRIFAGWWGDAKDGEEYVVRWRFDVVKGQEPDDDSDWPWHKVTEVIPA